MLKLRLTYQNMGQTESLDIPLPREMSHLWTGNTVTARVVEANTLQELGATADKVDVITAAAKWYASRNQKIEAIKIVRQWTACGLKEAKDWVEANCY